MATIRKKRVAGQMNLFTGAAKSKPKAKTTAYMALKKAKATFCKGNTTKAAVKKKATTYIKDAVKKGNKTMAEAKVAANKILRGGCKISSHIAGKKKSTAKKSAAKKRPAARRRTR